MSDTKPDTKLDIKPDKNPVYNKCVNCGRYIETELKNKSLFCCHDCYEKYISCNICNQYFNIDKTHAESLKCKIIFNTNQNKKPYIKHTLLKLFIFGNPLINLEMLTNRLSLIFKLPFFISEQFRIENKFTILQIKTHIKQKIKAENLRDYFIFLCNSYNTDFISEILKDLSFDQIITIDSEKYDINNDDNDIKLQICNNCGNINSFFMADSDDNNRCIICNSNQYRISEENITITNMLNKYQECKDFISLVDTNKKHINFTTLFDTANEIVRYFVYT